MIINRDEVAVMQKLPREFYSRETTVVAKSLLGHHLVYRIDGIERVGKIVEVEAYLGIASEITSHFWSINNHVFIGLAV